MANRKIGKILLKNSNENGKIPTSLDLGEIALNNANVILYASGTTNNSILPIGWDRISRTGDTMTGNLTLPSISATTYYNLPIDVTITGGTYSNGTITLVNNTGGTISISGISINNSGDTNTFITGGTLINNASTLLLRRNDDINLEISGFTSTITGITSIDFGFSGGLESDYSSVVVNNTNIKSDSSIIYRIIPSNDHNEIEDSLIEGIQLKESNIIEGISFTLNAFALNNSWGIYNIFYKIIN